MTKEELSELIKQKGKYKVVEISEEEYIKEIGSSFVDGYGYVQIEDKIVYVDDVLDKMQ